METAMSTTTIPDPVMVTQPNEVKPIEVDITTGAEYPDNLWREVTATIDAAEVEVIRARTIKRKADAAYETAMEQREAVQAPRDQMIATDRRTPARVARLAGIGRARCSQIRISVLRKMAQTTAEAEAAAA